MYPQHFYPFYPSAIVQSTPPIPQFPYQQQPLPPYYPQPRSLILEPIQRRPPPPPSPVAETPFAHQLQATQAQLAQQNLVQHQVFAQQQLLLRSLPQLPLGTAIPPHSQQPLPFNTPQPQLQSQSQTQSNSQSQFQSQSESPVSLDGSLGLELGQMQPTSSLPDWRTLFPNQLGPFHVVPAGVWFHSVIPDICAYELDVGRLLQSLQPFSPKDATGGSESPQIVSSLSRLQLLRRSGNSIRSMSSNTGVDSEAVGTVGSTSPWNALTTEHARVLPPHIRQRAASFAWCYPLPGFARLLASRGSSSGMCGSSGVPAEATADKIKNRKALRSESVLAFASVGGFVYTDVQGQVLYSVTIGKPNRSKHAASGSTGCTQTHPQAATSHLSGPNTSHKSYTTVMEFGAAHPWPLDLTDLLWKQGRFQPVSIKELFDGGARYFCWIRPSERVWSPSGQEYSSTWPNGAFAYLFGDDPFRDDPRNCCFPLQTVLQYPHPLFSQGTSPHHKVIKFSNFTVVPHSHSPYAIPPSQQQKDSPQFLHSPSTAPQQHLQTSPSSFHQTPPLLSQSSPLPPPYSPQVPPHVTSPPQTHLTTSSSGSTSPPPLQTSSSLETSGGLTDTMMRDLEVSVTICMACGIRRREAMCHPCLHFALCGECSLHCSSCPICHTHIANVVNLLS